MLSHHVVSVVVYDLLLRRRRQIPGPVIPPVAEDKRHAVQVSVLRFRSLLRADLLRFLGETETVKHVASEIRLGFFDKMIREFPVDKILKIRLYALLLPERLRGSEHTPVDVKADLRLLHVVRVHDERSLSLNCLRGIRRGHRIRLAEDERRAAVLRLKPDIIRAADLSGQRLFRIDRQTVPEGYLLRALNTVGFLPDAGNRILIRIEPHLGIGLRQSVGIISADQRSLCQLVIEDERHPDHGASVR